MRRKAQARKVSLATDHETDELDFILENTQNEFTTSTTNNSCVINKSIDLITECDLNCMSNFKRKSLITKSNEDNTEVETKAKQEDFKFDSCKFEVLEEVFDEKEEEDNSNSQINQSSNELNLSSNSLSNLKEYISTKIDIAVSCSYCGKSFASNSGLKQHMHIHGSVKPYTCDQCPKAYTQFSNLCRHKRSHYAYENSFVCRFCHLSFDSVLDLDKHKFNCKRRKRVKLLDENNNKISS